MIAGMWRTEIDLTRADEYDAFACQRGPRSGRVGSFRGCGSSPRGVALWVLSWSLPRLRGHRKVGGHTRNSPPVEPGGSPARTRAGLALLSVYLIWGSTYAAIRVAVHAVPAFTMAGLRYSLAGLILYPLARRRRSRPGLRAWALAALIGALLLAGGNGLLSFGERHVPSGIAALLVASVSLWLVLLQRIAQGTKISRRALAGLLAGFAGVAVLVVPTGAHGIAAGGAIVILIGSALWACGSLVSRSHPLGVDAFPARRWRCSPVAHSSSSSSAARLENGNICIRPPSTSTSASRSPGSSSPDR